MNWLCVVILAIPVLYIFKGIQRGMVRTAFSVFSVVLALVLGFILNPYITEFLKEKTPIYETVQKQCEESISGALKEQLDQKIKKEEQNAYIQNLPLPESLTDFLVEHNTTEGYNQLLADTFGEYLSRSIAQIAIAAVSLIFTSILISIALNFLGGILDGIFSLPVLSLLNRAGCAVLGIVQGVFVVWILFLIITLFWDVSWAQNAAMMFQENSVTKWLYDNNILVQLLSGTGKNQFLLY